MNNENKYYEFKKLCDDNFGGMAIEVINYIDELENDKKKSDSEHFKLRQFLINGFEFGYIHFSDIDENDPAFETFKNLFGENAAEKIRRK